LAEFQAAGQQERTRSKRDLGFGGERDEDADDLRGQVVAGTVFNFIGLDGLGREQEDADGGQGLANHKPDQADALAGEALEFGGKFETAVADGAEELGEIEVRHAVGSRRQGRKESAGVATEFIPLGGGAGPGDLGGSGRGVATAGEETGRRAAEEKHEREAERKETHRLPI